MWWRNQLTSLYYIEYALFHWNPISSPQIPFRALCFPEKGYMGIHHTSFIGANNWKFTFTITRAASTSRPGTRGKYEPWSVSGAETGRWPGSAGITRDTNKESINNIAHEGKGKLASNQKQPVCNLAYLVCNLWGYLTSGLICLVSVILSKVWCYKVHFVLNLNGSQNTLPHWGCWMWTRLPSNRRRTEAGARQRASPASYSPSLPSLVRGAHTGHTSQHRILGWHRLVPGSQVWTPLVLPLSSLTNAPALHSARLTQSRKSRK